MFRKGSGVARKGGFKPSYAVREWGHDFHPRDLRKAQAHGNTLPELGSTFKQVM
jgi:hypothetical protein